MWPFRNKTLDAVRTLAMTTDLSLSSLEREVERLSCELDKYHRGMGATLDGISRIIAKLDPLFAVPEDDPDRAAASRKLERDIITKLTGEFLARNR